MPLLWSLFGTDRVYYKHAAPTALIAQKQIRNVRK